MGTDLFCFDGIGLTARLFQACIDTLTAFVHEYADLATVQRLLLRRVLQTLIIWGEDHKVASGALDSSLQKSTRRQQAVLSALLNIANVLTKGRQPICTS